MTTTGVGNWLHDRVTQPLATFATRRLSGARDTEPRHGALADAPTELLLVQAVESAVGALPEAHRESMRQVDGVARGLAAEATALRARAHRLDAREAEALMLRESAERESQLTAVRAERQDVKERLVTAMTALESLRLDMLRLAADRTDGDLTSQLEEVREVQRRVDAAMDVRRLLNAATPAGTG